MALFFSFPLTTIILLQLCLLSHSSESITRCYSDDSNEESLIESKISKSFTMVQQSLPSHVDWREKAAVTSVREQGKCRACWAIAVVGAVESKYKIVTGELLDLSVQEVVDCNYYKKNCKTGGTITDAFEFVIGNGLLEESAYPYTGTTRKCNYNVIYKHTVMVDDYKFVSKGDERALMAAVVEQPVAVGLAVNLTAFQEYKGGTFRGPCEVERTHAVLVVGYGTDSNGDYWLMKNSFGREWGDEGYMKFERGSGLCGIARAAAFPTFATN